MLRDNRKNKKYFDKYLVAQNNRIMQFEEVLAKLENDNTKLMQVKECKLFLANFYKDKFYAQYSYGENIENLKSTFIKYMHYVLELDKKTYSDLETVLSLAILLDVNIKDEKFEMDCRRDAMTKVLYAFVANGEMSSTDEKTTLLFPTNTEIFYRCLNKEVTPEELKKYLNVEWYASQSEMAWYDTANQTTETYCGYWCFLGAAIVKLCNFDKELFKDCMYFPYDLI